MPLETGSIPTKFTHYVGDPAKPCIWVFYRKAEDIPAVYFHRSGFEKPEKPGVPLKKLSIHNQTYQFLQAYRILSSTRYINPVPNQILYLLPQNQYRYMD